MTATQQSPASATRTPIVLVADKLAPAGVALLEQAGLEVRVQQGLSPEELVAAAAEVDGILVRSASKVTEQVMEGAPRLKAVGRAGIGVDNIDVAAATRRGVVVMNTPLANATTTAELAIAHLFGLARHTAKAQASMRAGRWDKASLSGREVTGKTLVVVGLGKIGRIVAERGLGLRMRVLAHDPFLTGPSPIDQVELVDFERALAEADVLSLHVPRTDATLGLIDAAALAKMKPDACLINCARGGLVDEDALVAALDAGRLAGAALDVFATEPLPEDSPLRQVENLLMTPHLGASSSEAQERVSTEIAAQMIDFLTKGEARCAINAPSLTAEQLTHLRPFLQLARRGASMLAQATDEAIEQVEITTRGALAEGDTAAIKLAVIAGLLAPTLDGPVNDVNAEALADERGLRVLEERDRVGRVRGADLQVRVRTTGGQELEVAGTVLLERPRLTRFAGFGVDLVPEGTLLMTRHRDAPGVLAQVASVLGEQGVNIGGLHMSARRPEDDLAIALFTLDRALERAELDALAGLDPLVAARSLVL